MQGLEQRLAREAVRRQELLAGMEELDKEIAEQEKQLSVLQAELQRLERETLSAQESYTAAKVNLAALESQIEADEAAASRYRSALIEADQRAEAAAAAASHLTREQGELAREIDGLDIKYNQLIENLKDIEAKLLDGSRRREAGKRIGDGESHKAKQQQKEALQERLADTRRLLDKIALKKSQLSEVMMDEYGLAPEAVSDVRIHRGDAAEMRRSLRMLKEQIQALGPVDTGAIQQFEEVKERYDSSAAAAARSPRGRAAVETSDR